MALSLLLSSKISTVPMQVLPHLDYCSVVWHEYTPLGPTTENRNEANLKLVKAIQDTQ